jgi:hypothetical protein
MNLSVASHSAITHSRLVLTRKQIALNHDDRELTQGRVPPVICVDGRNLTRQRAEQKQKSCENRSLRSLHGEDNPDIHGCHAAR